MCRHICNTCPIYWKRVLGQFYGAVKKKLHKQNVQKLTSTLLFSFVRHILSVVALNLASCCPGTGVAYKSKDVNPSVDLAHQQQLAWLPQAIQPQTAEERGLQIFHQINSYK